VTPASSRLLAAVACAHPCFQGASLQYNKAGAMELDFHSVPVHACLPSLSLAGSLIHPDNKSPSPALFSDVCACVSVCVRVPVVDSSLWCVACPCFPHSIIMFFNSKASIKCISCSRRRGCDEFPDRSRRSQRCRVAAFPCLCLHSDS